MALAPGTRLGPYDIVAPIGAGGMGEVYRANDPRLGREVAIKVLPPGFAQDAERLARFEREARAVAGLSHPNILSIFDFGTADGITYAVTELLEGETLRARMGQGPMAPRRAVDIATQVALGLAAAHDKGIVHRDIKPENLFLTSDGRVKILDFGLARPVAITPAAEGPTVLGAENATTPGTIVGTIGYMAPEQIRGEAVDGRTDIFAFGSVLYELLTGERSFQGPSPADTMSAILKEDPAEIKTREGAIPPTLDHLVRRCLEKAPGRRFQSAHDLAFALAHALGSSSTLVAPAIAPDARPASRGSVVGYVVVAAAALAAGFLGARFWPSAAPASAAPAFAALTLDSGVEDWPSLSPDGASFLYVSSAAGNADIYLRRLDGRNATNLTADSPEADTMPAFSPDGRFIAFRSNRDSGGIFVMEAGGENVKKVSDQGFNPAWSPDGRTIAYATEATANPAGRNTNSVLWVVDVTTGERREVSDTDAMQPSWSPDGRRIAVWSVDGGRRLLKSVAVDSGEATPVFDSDPTVMYWNPVWASEGWLFFSSNESGAMTIGRVRVDASGRAAGPRETLVTPAAWAGQLAVSLDARRIAYQSVTSRWTLWRSDFDPVRGAAAPPVQLMSGALSVGQMGVSADGATLAFTNQGTAANEDIFTIDRDGRRLRQLTDDAARDRGPSWSPDGARVLFYSNRRGPYEIWSVNPDGSDLRVVASAPDKDDWLFPRVSRANLMSVLSLTKGGAILDAASAPPMLSGALPPLDSADELFWPLAWSPDGSTLAGLAQSNTRGLQRDLVLYRPASSAYQRHAGVGNIVDWLPDGKRLLTVLESGFQVVDAQTGQATPVILRGAEGTLNPFITALSKDGRSLYWSSAAVDSDLWLMTLGSR
jgi:Tol biopolymer transport system component